MTEAAERFAFPAAAEHVAAARSRVAAVGQAAGLPAARLGDVRLAVGEAVTNAIVHAFRDRAPGTITVDAAVAGRVLTVSVTDDGVGMAPRPDSPGAGVGLPLIASVADAFEARTLPGGGTRVTMRFEP